MGAEMVFYSCLARGWRLNAWNKYLDTEHLVLGSTELRVGFVVEHA